MSAGDYIALIGLIVTVVITVGGLIAAWAVYGQRVKNVETKAEKWDEERAGLASLQSNLQLLDQRVKEHDRRLEGHSHTLDTVKQMEGDVRRLVQDVEEIRGLLRELLPARTKPASEAETLIAGLRALLAEKQRVPA